MPKTRATLLISALSVCALAANWPSSVRLDQDGTIRSPLHCKNGYVLTVIFRPHQSSPHARRFNPDGTSTEIRVSLPDADSINFYSGSITDSTGRSVLAGLAVSADGRGAGVLTLVDEHGRMERVIRTNPFLIKEVSVASDGTIWGLGYDMEVGAGRQSAEMVHRYRQDGTLLGRYVPRQEVVSKGGPRSHPANAGDAGTPRILASQDRIGIHLPEASTWMEFSLEGTLLAKDIISPAPTTGPDAGSDVYENTVMTVSGRVFSVSRSGAKTRLLELDRAAKKWVVVPSIPRGALTACGCDGEQIVSRQTGGPETAFGTATIPTTE